MFVKVFISWSGDKSQHAAQAIADWLPSIANEIEPMLSLDIEPGARWQSMISSMLEQADTGIICVTRDNQNSPWLNFEAGALAKSLDRAQVVPLALDLEPADITGPLAQFQIVKSTRDDLTGVVSSMNRRLTNPLTERRFGLALDKWWPDLEAELQGLLAPATGETSSPEQVRDNRELLEEIVESVRTLLRRNESPVVNIANYEPETLSGTPIISMQDFLAEAWDEMTRSGLSHDDVVFTHDNRRQVTVHIRKQSVDSLSLMNNRLRELATVRGYSIRIKRADS